MSDESDGPPFALSVPQGAAAHLPTPPSAVTGLDLIFSSSAKQGGKLTFLEQLSALESLQLYRTVLLQFADFRFMTRLSSLSIRTITCTVYPRAAVPTALQLPPSLTRLEFGNSYAGGDGVPDDLLAQLPRLAAFAGPPTFLRALAPAQLQTLRELDITTSRDSAGREG